MAAKKTKRAKKAPPAPGKSYIRSRIEQLAPEHGWDVDETVKIVAGKKSR